MKSRDLVMGAIAVVSFMAGYHLAEPKVEIEERIVEVVKVQERVRVDTVIETRPDGSSTTTIVEKKDTDTNKEAQIVTSTKPAQRDWLVGVTANRDLIVNGFQVSRRIIFDAYLGVQVTDPFTGNDNILVTLTYNF